MHKANCPTPLFCKENAGFSPASIYFDPVQVSRLANKRQRFG
jgi:hypothetical protein